MIIERRLTPYLVFPEDSLLAALQKMTDNRERTVFVVDSHGFLVGSLTDGDVRRWLVAHPEASLDVAALVQQRQVQRPGGQGLAHLGRGGAQGLSLIHI